jgi:hypothetical protein
MKALDDMRLGVKFVIGIDGTGVLAFKTQHCSKCLTQMHGDTTVYFHPVLEAKLLGSIGLALSVCSEFIENPFERTVKATTYETIKQDCELKAFDRLAKSLKERFPRTPMCLSGDSEYGCGTAIVITKANGWSFVFVFKPGRTPALWKEFLALLELQPGNSRSVTLPDGTKQKYRWVNHLPYQDSEARTHDLNAILCKETCGDITTTYAWITDLEVNANTVISIATKGGRIRSNIENGFNTQKNSGLNLEHAYSTGQDTYKSFYYLLQIAHTILQMLEKGSLLKKLSQAFDSTPIKLFGSLKNLARRLFESFRYLLIPDMAFDPGLAAQCQIRLDST